MTYEAIIILLCGMLVSQSVINILSVERERRKYRKSLSELKQELDRLVTNYEALIKIVETTDTEQSIISKN